MSVQGETALQERIQKYIRRRGGYVHKNWGQMTSAPGIADLTVCYRGYYIAVEVKDRNNTPSPAQGIHCREVQKAGGITIVTWDVATIEKVLDIIDTYKVSLYNVNTKEIIDCIKNNEIDDGTRW